VAYLQREPSVVKGASERKLSSFKGSEGSTLNIFESPVHESMVIKIREYAITIVADAVETSLLRTKEGFSSQTRPRIHALYRRL